MRLKRNPLLLLFLLPFLNSCISNADFDQLDLNAEPIVSFPLVFFELNQLDFLDETGTIELEAASDVSDLDFFESDTFREDLLRADFLFEVKNSFNRSFFINIELLDINNNPTYTFNQIALQPLMPDFVEFRENIIIADHPNVVNTRRVKVTAILTTGSTILDPDVAQRLEFKSSGIFYLKID
jgi:hypothetical protein